MTSICLRGPDIAIVGWIPYFDRMADLPAGHNYKASLAMHLLFNSGNNEPPKSFADYHTFIAWLRSRRDYRGALYIHDVILRYKTGKPAPIISYQVEGVMGYTPLQLKFPGISVSLPGRLGRLKGQSPNDYIQPLTNVLPGNRGISITFNYRFKLSPIMDVLQRAITGRWAPNAWAGIDYEISNDGRVRIATTGTSIPTQDVYIDWVRDDSLRSNMLQIGSKDVESFLNDTPGCADAPRYSRRTMARNAIDCDKI